MTRSIPTPRTVLAVAVTGGLLLAACSGDDAAPTTTTTSTTTSTSTTSTTTSTTSTSTLPPTTTTVPDVPRMPLTGVPIQDESEIPNRPALIVKISNAPLSVVPQAGLNHTDLVIEEVINANSTRFAAVFQSDGHDPVGPIRSGRAQDINLLRALNHPLFAWSGGNPSVTQAVRESDLVDLDFRHASGYYRRSGRKSPNNLYSNTDALWAQAPADAVPPPQVFQYLRADEQLTGEPATAIDVTLDSVHAHWEYDPTTNRYFRWQNGSEHTTESNGGVEQVWVDNLVVMMADYGRNPADGNPDAQVMGSNPVYVFSGGTVREGVWLRFNPTDPYLFVDDLDHLNPIGLVPGRTWLEIPRNDPANIAFGAEPAAG